MNKSISNSKNRLLGIILSYANTFLNMLITLFIVPALLKTCGETDYSVYKIMSSFASPLSIVNFGVATYVARGIAQCNQSNDEFSIEKRKKIMGMSVIISLFLFFVACIIAGGFYLFINTIYEKTFTNTELELAKKIFIIIALSICIHIIDDGFQGCLIGNEEFISLYGITLIRSILKGIVLFTIILFKADIIFVALADCFLTFLALILKIIYVKSIIKEKFVYNNFDINELKIFLSFSIAMVLQTIVNNINQSMDNVILGAMISDKSIITMYSSALTIFTIFISMTTVFSGVFSTIIIKAVSAGESEDELTEKAIVPARCQAVLSFLIVTGYIIFGRQFINLWIGDKYQNAYYVGIILLIPAAFVSVSTIYEAFLDAKLKRLKRSLILFGMAMYNAIVSIILTPFIGFWGAAIGTATSYIIGNIFILNIYSARVSGVRVCRLYKGAFSGIWKTILLSLIIAIPLTHIDISSWCILIILISIYTIIYGGLILLFGLKKEEKKNLFNKIKRGSKNV